MKDFTKELIWDTTRITLSVLFSVVLVCLAVVVPFYYSITGLTKPKAVASVVQSIDYVQMVDQSAAVQQALSGYGVDGKAADEIMKSKETGNLIQEYADKVTEILLTIPSDRPIDMPLIREVVDDNLDKVLNVAEENAGVALPRKEITTVVDSFIDENQQEIKQSLPLLETARAVIKTVRMSAVVSRTMTWQFGLLLGLVGAALMAAILLFHKKNAAGLLWITVDSGIAAALLLLLMLFSRHALVNTVAQNISGFGTDIVRSAIRVSTDTVQIGLIAAIACMLLFLGTYIGIRLHKRAARKGSAAENCT